MTLPARAALAESMGRHDTARMLREIAAAMEHARAALLVQRFAARVAGVE